MSITLEQIILDAKRVANRLKDREALGDSLLVETESVNKQIESMRFYNDDIETLNKICRDNSNAQLINMIHQENPHIREMQQENRELRACLEDHQRALEMIMTKYREHTQNLVIKTRVTIGDVMDTQKNEIILKQANKIEEMAAVMQTASSVDEENMNKENEHLSQLITENKVCFLDFLWKIILFNQNLFTGP